MKPWLLSFEKIGCFDLKEITNKSNHGYKLSQQQKRTCGLISSLVSTSSSMLISSGAKSQMSTLTEYDSIYTCDNLRLIRFCNCAKLALYNSTFAYTHYDIILCLWLTNCELTNVFTKR